MTTIYPSDQFAAYAARAERLLSSEGLFNAGTIDRITTAMPSIPKAEFAEGNPKTVVFNFLVKLVQLSDQVGMASGSYYLADMGEGNFPLVEISRVSTHLVNLVLHPALEPLGEQGQQLLFAFARANESDAEAVRALVASVLWLREVMRMRYRAFNAGDKGNLVLDQVEAFKDHLAQNYGANGMFVGACARQAALVLGLLQDVAEKGQLDAPGDCVITGPEDAEPSDLTRTLNLALRLHFGAKGTYLDWPDEEGSAVALDGPVVSDQNGVLLLWDGAVVIPGLAGNDPEAGLSLQWMAASGRLRADGYEQALAFFPLV